MLYLDMNSISTWNMSPCCIYCYCSHLVWTGFRKLRHGEITLNYSQIILKSLVSQQKWSETKMFSTMKEAMQARDQFGYKRLLINLKSIFRHFFQAQRRGWGRGEEEGGWEKEEGGRKGKTGCVWGNLWCQKLMIVVNKI